MAAPNAAAPAAAALAMNLPILSPRDLNFEVIPLEVAFALFSKPLREALAPASSTFTLSISSGKLNILFVSPLISYSQALSV